MDKQEYKILLDEILNLVSEERFEEAVDIADRIDWRKVRRYTILQKISNLYRINGRFDEALEIIGYAYDKNPTNKQIIYEICDLYLELGDLVNALQYMAVYKKLAPSDVGNAKLKFKILELEEASFEDRVEQLEKIVSLVYQEEWEEWAYQLAYMYHRMGLATKCVEVCNQVITRKGEGPFVIKAMELKMLHQKLTAEQQKIYDHRNDGDVVEELESFESDEIMPGQEDLAEDDFRVKTIDMSKFNTMNLQKALAESMRELMGEDTQELLDTGSIPLSSLSTPDDEVEELEDGPEINDADVYASEAEYEENYDENYEDNYEGEYEEEIPYDDNSYNETEDDIYTEDGQEIVEDETRFILPEDLERSGIEDTEIKETAIANEEGNTPSVEQNVFFDDKTGDIVIDEVPLGMLNDLIPGVEFVPHEKPVSKTGAIATGVAAGVVAGTVVAASVENQKDPVKTGNTHRFDDVLAYDQDGQLKLVVPDNEKVEKQITGQMNLEDVLYEWEKMKKDRDDKEKADIKKNILERTGKIFEDYDEGKKNSILAQIEEEQKAQRKVLNNDLELKKLDDIVSENTASLKRLANDEIISDVAMTGVEGVATATAAAATAKGTEAVGAFAAGAVAGAVAGELLPEDMYDEDGNLLPEYEDEYLEEEYLEDGEYLPEDEYAEDGEYIPEDEYLEEEYTEEGDYESEDFVDDENFSDEDIQEDDLAEEETLDEETPEEETDRSENKETEDRSDESEDDNSGPSLNTEQISDIGSILEATADETTQETMEEMDDNYDSSEERDFSVDEQELFSDFLYSKKMRAQILESLDVVSLAAYVGNVIITGDSGTGAINLAKAVIKEIQLIDGNFVASKVAKISGAKMNQKDIQGLFTQLANGALIVEKAGKLNKNTLQNITRALEGTSDGIIVILTDTKKEMEKLIKSYDVITGYFNARIDIVPMNNNALVEYAKKYAYSLEYKIDEERAVLALHERISELQIGEHHVTTAEVESIVDSAIEYSKKPHISTFANIIIGKRYDYDDMIILREKDFRA